MLRASPALSPSLALGVLALACAPRSPAAPPTRFTGAVDRDTSALGGLTTADAAAGPGALRRLPGEHEPVGRVALAWSVSDDDGFRIFALDVIAALYGRVPLSLLVAPEDVEDAALWTGLRADADPDALELLVGPVDTPWIRDFGPFTVRRGDGAFEVVDTPYMTERPGDDQVPLLLASRLALDHAAFPYLLEGGHLLADGEGRCLLSDDAVYRNMALGTSDDAFLDAVSATLGCDDVTLVPALVDEPTGHVDLFAYVVGPGAVLVGDYPGEDEPVNGRILDEIADTLAVAGWHVRRIPMPSSDGRAIFRSYTNALAVNDLVLVPVYDEDRRYEARALAEFRRAFPGREIVPIPSDALIPWGGAVHCAALGIPAR